MKRFVILFAAGSLVATFAATLHAQPKKKEPGAKGVITLNDITIVGRVQKPVAAIDLARIRPKLALTEMQQPFVDRIEEATYKDPF